MNFSKRNIIIGIIVLILIAAIPVTLYLVRQTQIFKPKAASSSGGEIKFRGPSVSGEGCLNPTGECTATNRNIQLEITNPFVSPAP